MPHLTKVNEAENHSCVILRTLYNVHVYNTHNSISTYEYCWL